MALVNDGPNPGVGPVSGVMQYDVTRRGPDGQEVVTVSAKTGDEAAAKAYMAGTIVVGVTPHDTVQTIIERPRPLTLQGNADGSTAAGIEQRNLVETELQAGNAERVAKAAELSGAGTTNAVGIEGAKGLTGTASADLPAAKRPVAKPEAKAPDMTVKVVK